MKLFNYTKWEVLETYINNGVWYCVQVRMDRNTGYKKFKVNRITNFFGWCSKDISIEKINNNIK